MADGTRATDEIFLNEENGHGWQEEASAVIRDVRDFVKDICFAEKLQSSKSRIYLNLVTKENCNYTVELTSSGFRIVGKTLNNVDSESERFFETPYALLNSISPMFQKAFGEKLVHQLEKVQEAQADGK